MKFKSKSTCLTEVVLDNFQSVSSATATASSTSTGDIATNTIIHSDNLSFISAYNLAYSTAAELFPNKEDIIIKDTKSSIENDCIEYIYTFPQKIQLEEPFTLYYISTNININHIYQLIYKDNALSTFEPNIKLAEINNDNIENTYLSNVTIDSKVNPNECFVSSNILPNSVYTIDINNGIYNVYLDNLSSGLQEPVGIEFDEFNNTYIANFFVSNIQVFNPKKELIDSITNPLFKNLGGLGFYKGNLYALNGFPIDDILSPYYGLFIMFKIVLIVDDNNNIIYDVQVFCTNTLNAPLFICFDKNDFGYVTNFNNNTISKINMTTGEAEVYIDATQGLIGPRGIVIDQKSNLYVSSGDVSTQIFVISKIDINKTVTIYTTKNLNSPRGLALDDDENLYICNIGSLLIKIIRNKCIFHVSNNILEKGDNLLTIKDITDNVIVESFILTL